MASKPKTDAPPKAKQNRNDQRKPDAPAAAGEDVQANLAAGDAKARKTAKPDPRAAPAATNLARRLISHVIDEIRALPKPWVQLSEVDQDDVIQRVRKNAEELLADVVTVAATGGDYRKVVLELATVNVKAKTTVAQLNIGSGESESIHNLLDARGQMVCLVLGVDPRAFGVGNDGVKPEKDQRPLL